MTAGAVLVQLDAGGVRLADGTQLAVAGISDLLAEQGDFEGADKEFREALRIEPNLAEAHAGLARALSAQGKKDQAVQHYQEAVRILKSQSQNQNEGFNK